MTRSPTRATHPTTASINAPDAYCVQLVGPRYTLCSELTIQVGVRRLCCECRVAESSFRVSRISSPLIRPHPRPVDYLSCFSHNRGSRRNAKSNIWPVYCARRLEISLGLFDWTVGRSAYLMASKLSCTRGIGEISRSKGILCRTDCLIWTIGGRRRVAESVHNGSARSPMQRGVCRGLTASAE